jgi:hypothetical protein
MVGIPILRCAREQLSVYPSLHNDYAVGGLILCHRGQRTRGSRIHQMCSLRFYTGGDLVMVVPHSGCAVSSPLERSGV